MSYSGKMLRRLFSKSPITAQATVRSVGRRNLVEPLERRDLFSLYIITGLADTAGVVTQPSPGIFLSTTLRGAVNAANANADSDVIGFQNGVTGTITLGTAGVFAVDHDLAIVGPAANLLTIDAHGASRIFNSAAGVNFNLANLTLNGGFSDGAGGGAIRNSGVLIFSGLTIQNSNTLDADGAGVFNLGTVVALSSTFSGNNAAGGGGGGLFNNGAGAIVINSTFNGNQADFGGGVYNADTKFMFMDQCTISGNHATTSGGGMAGPLNDPLGLAGTLIYNTIMAQNTFGPTPTGQGPDMYGVFNADSAGNLVGSLGFAKGMNPATNKLGGIENATPVINANLAALAFNGGQTKTMLPQAGSPAIDSGSNLAAAGITSDQRGSARIQNNIVDIGAVETSPPAARVSSVGQTSAKTSMTTSSKGVKSLKGLKVL